MTQRFQVGTTSHTRHAGLFSSLLDLVETRTFGSRVVYERYGRARD
jgi:hypothetical protein